MNVGNQIFNRLLLHIGNNHGRTFTGKHPGGRLAHAAGGAGNNGGFIG
nr:hypothetical protein [Neisseria weixii]